MPRPTAIVEGGFDVLSVHTLRQVLSSLLRGGAGRDENFYSRVFRCLLSIPRNFHSKKEIRRYKILSPEVPAPPLLTILSPEFYTSELQTGIQILAGKNNQFGKLLQARWALNPLERPLRVAPCG